MKRRKVAKRKLRLIDIHMYGIFDLKKKKIIKVSLDKTEIEMEFALNGGENLSECEFRIKLAI